MRTDISQKTAILSLLLLTFSTVWLLAADLPEIRRRGVLRVAARPVSTLIFSPGNSEFPGFCYEIAREFAGSQDLEIAVQLVNSFGAYWQHSDDNRSLSLFQEVDLYAEILTVTSDRQELLSMVPYVDNTEILVGRADSRATELSDLRGKRVAVIEGMSFQQVLEDALSQQEIAYRLVPAALKGGAIVPRDRAQGGHEQGQGVEEVQLFLLPPGMPTTLMFFPGQLTLDSVDFFVADSFSLFHQLNVSQSLRSLVRPLFPVNGAVGELALGTSSDTPQLTNTLSRWMTEFRTTAAYESLVQRYLGISYDRYCAFIEDFPQ
ncbi:MAG: transporter substrate-binding domain-containing protein [Alkalispirochaeta sp.]